MIRYSPELFSIYLVFVNWPDKFSFCLPDLERARYISSLLVVIIFHSSVFPSSQSYSLQIRIERRGCHDGNEFDFWRAYTGSGHDRVHRSSRNGVRIGKIGRKYRQPLALWRASATVSLSESSVSRSCIGSDVMSVITAHDYFSKLNETILFFIFPMVLFSLSGISLDLYRLHKVTIWLLKFWNREPDM